MHGVERTGRATGGDARRTHDQVNARGNRVVNTEEE